VALSPKLSKKKKKTSCAAVWTELNRMFACIRRRQIIAANEKFGFQPLLERVERCCWCNRDWQAVPHPSCGNRESPLYKFIVELKTLNGTIVLSIVSIL